MLFHIYKYDEQGTKEKVGEVSSRIEAVTMAGKLCADLAGTEWVHVVVKDAGLSPVIVEKVKTAPVRNLNRQITEQDGAKVLQMWKGGRTS